MPLGYHCSCCGFPVLIGYLDASTHIGKFNQSVLTVTWKTHFDGVLSCDQAVLGLVYEDVENFDTLLNILHENKQNQSLWLEFRLYIDL